MRRPGRWAAALGAAALVLAVIAIVLLAGGGERRRGRGSSTPAPRAGPPALPAPAKPLLGLNVNRLLLDRTYSPAQIDAQLARSPVPGPRMLGPTHCGRQRNRLHPSAESITTTGPSRTGSPPPWPAMGCGGCRSSTTPRGGLRSIPGQDHSPPRNASSYAAYAGAFAARYGPGGSFWAEHPMIAPLPVTTYEIWNEPDGGHFWLPRPDPRRYAVVVRGRALGDQGGRPRRACADRRPDQPAGVPPRPPRRRAGAARAHRRSCRPSVRALAAGHPRRT